MAKLPANPLGHKICTGMCKSELPLSEFYIKGKSRPGEFDSVCKSCKSKYWKVWFKKNKDKKREMTISWRKRNRERALAGRRAYCLRVRQEMLAAYGNICVCCGENNPEFLAVDHIYGGGCKERRENKKVFPGIGFHLYLRRLGFPKDKYRLLCHNCNQSRGLYGYCPHERAIEKLLGSVSGKEVQLLPHA